MGGGVVFYTHTLTAGLFRWLGVDIHCSELCVDNVFCYMGVSVRGGVV